MINEPLPAALLTQRPGRSTAPMVELDLEVVTITDLTPSMRRLTLHGDALAGFSYEPGQDLMFAMPAGDRTVRRRYTIRRLDVDTLTVEVDFLLHGHGPGARWASNVGLRDTIRAVGPRGRVNLGPIADWHLFVGDDSAIPATLAMLEAASAQTPTIAVLEVEDATHEQPSALPVTWLHRLGVQPGATTQLVAHLSSFRLPAGTGAVYLNGERQWIRAARDVLVHRGVDPDVIRLKAYWVLTEANGDHGEPVPEGGFDRRPAG
jgi:NADPH-dependent ferric siderophore reductase